MMMPARTTLASARLCGDLALVVARTTTTPPRSRGSGHDQASTTRKTAEAAAALATLSAADILEAQDKRGAIDPVVCPLWQPIAISGPAFTVRAPSGDNLAVHRALAVAPAGCVLVVEVEGDASRRALAGDIIGYAAKRRGLHGLVTNGVV